ncbi:unnamed protein product [Vitrella brassicaformis CCMP3155]|uniref:dolichyl-phosphate-mannose--protein mannosyltransferase n=1 Tax=Vitrella brassicaformis (strain CCMP3155) TaxID=1169540 RepID=A0A0G4G353_VITBC|nr:unnamed protein product [Vitrella brassicaformis CCMP3155]|eukprot:CEM22530.1 unnamed protein product [Vitrella brassicaformis CCMP3155]
MAEAPEDSRQGWALLVAISECVKSKDVDRLEQLLDDNRELIERLEASLRTDNDGSRQEETNAEDTNEDPPSEEEPPPSPSPPPPVQPAVDTSTEPSESGSNEEQQQQQQQQQQNQDHKQQQDHQEEHQKKPSPMLLCLSGASHAILYVSMLLECLGKALISAMHLYPIWCVAVILSVALLVHSPGLSYGDFVMDDTVAVVKNSDVTGAAFSWRQLMRHDFWGSDMFTEGVWTHKSFRPFTTLSYRFNYLLSGIDTTAFHATNVLLHLPVVLLVAVACYSVLGLGRVQSLIAAGLFAVHPVHTENVFYLVGRADILAAIPFVMAIIDYAAAFSPFFRPVGDLLAGQMQPLAVLCDLLMDGKRRRKPSKGEEGDGTGPGEAVAWSEEARGGHHARGSEGGGWSDASLRDGAVAMLRLVIWATLAGLCKEIGFTVYGIIFLLEALTLHHHIMQIVHTPTAPPAAAATKTHCLKSALRLLIVATLTAFTFVARHRYTGGTTLKMSPQDNPISFEPLFKTRALSFAYIHSVYGRLLVWPFFLCYDYSKEAIPMVRSFGDMRLLAPLACYLSLASACVWGLVTLLTTRRERHGEGRAVAMGLALLVVPFLPASNVLFHVGTVVGERLLYLPSIGFCVMVPCVVATIVKRSESMRSSGNGNGSKGERGGHRLACLMVLVCGVTVAVWGYRSYLRALTWESGARLNIVDGLRQLRSAKTQFNLGITYMMAQQFDMAREALQRSISADPESVLPYWRLGQMCIFQGNFSDAENWLGEARSKYGGTFVVRDEEVFHDYAVALHHNGKPQEAVENLQLALKLNPNFAKGLNNLACATVQKDIRTALDYVKKAVESSPHQILYWANLHLLARHTGEKHLADMALQSAQQLDLGFTAQSTCVWQFEPAE